MYLSKNISSSPNSGAFRAWLKRVGQQFFHGLKTAFFRLPQRLFEFGKQLFRPLAWLFGQRKRPFRWGFWQHFAAWWTRLISRLLDVLAFGEMMDLFFTIFKVKSRSLSPMEIEEAKKVLPEDLPWQLIRVDEKSLIAKLGAKINQAAGLGICLFRSVNFSCKIYPKPGNHDMDWLIHELVHVAQYEYKGFRYIPEALHGQKNEGYGYGFEEGLCGREFRSFNREQQADILKHAYQKIRRGEALGEYARMIEAAKQKQF